MDWLKKVRPGERLNVPARAWNGVVDLLSPQQSVLAQGPSLPDFRAIAITARWKKADADDYMSQWPLHISTLPAGHKLRVGYAVPLKLVSGVTAFLGEGSTAQMALSDLAETVLNPFLTIESFEGGSELFGIIRSVARVPATDEFEAHYSLQLVVAGVFVCRCLAFAIADRIVGPTGIPFNENIKPMWYPYPMMSVAGSAKVLAVGNYWRITANQWPRIYEVLVSM